ncbi:hypothetical protein B7463_g9539, partial [Scytalidium lignicola]
MFVADVLDPYDVYKGPANEGPALLSGAQFPVNDPLYLVPALTAVTKNIAFGITASTTYDAPYGHARRFSTVDHYSEGRVAWNIVTSYLDSAARNIERAKFTTRANTSMFLDPISVNLLLSGLLFFSKLAPPKLGGNSAQSTQKLSFLAKGKYGHDPNHIKIITGITIIVAETDEAAQVKRDDLLSYGNKEGALALFGSWTSIDLSTNTDDEDFRFSKLAAIQSIVNGWDEIVPGSKYPKWTKSRIAEYLILGGMGSKIVGSPVTVVDKLERFSDVANVDGFNIAHIVNLGSFEDIIEFILPELQNRGLFRTEVEKKGPENMPPGPDLTFGHMRKRLRVPVSCAHCRKRKIKCDGNRPCSNCALREDHCVYAQDSDNDDNHATKQNQQDLRSRVERLESLLRFFLSSEDGENTLIGNSMAGYKPSSQSAVALGSSPQVPGKAPANDIDYIDEKDRMPLIERMLEAAEIDDQGNWIYQGHSSSQSFLRSMRLQLGPFINDEAGKDIKVLNLPIRRAIDAAMDQDWRAAVALPPRSLAEELVTLAIYDACGIMFFIHRPSFFGMLHRIYCTPAESYGKQERGFLPLLYAAIAVGFVFKNDPIGSPAKDRAFQDGTRYFIASRQLLDLTNCRTLYSLQTLLFMFLFYQCTGQMTKAYTVISIGLTSALQMGLHRNLPIKTDLVELEARKRTFWVIRKLEVYVGSMFGLPGSLRSDDIDQVLPADADDDYITEQVIYPMPHGEIYPMLAANAHTKMFMILTKILEVIQPAQSIHASARREMLVVSSKNVASLEQQIQFYLRIGFYYVKFNLYRPFLYYVNPQKQTGLCEKCYGYGYSCITVSRDIISAANTMYNRRLLEGEAWFPVHATFSAIMALAYFTLRNKDHSEVQNVTKDALLGHQILTSLSKHSLWADRCLRTLKPVVERLSRLVESFNDRNPLGKVKRPKTPSSDPILRQPTKIKIDEESSPVNDTTAISGQQSSSEELNFHALRSNSTAILSSFDQSHPEKFRAGNMIPTPTSQGLDPDHTVLSDLEAWVYPTEHSSYFGFDDPNNSHSNSDLTWSMNSAGAADFMAFLPDPSIYNFPSNPDTDMELVESGYVEK